MLTLAITLPSGESMRLTVEQAEFVRTCPYCEAEFLTIDPDRLYCRPSHGVRIREARIVKRRLVQFPVPRN